MIGKPTAGPIAEKPTLRQPNRTLVTGLLGAGAIAYVFLLFVPA